MGFFVDKLISPKFLNLSLIPLVFCGVFNVLDNKFTFLGSYVHYCVSKKML